MAYFGKQFAVVSEENYVDFINILGLPADEVKKFAAYKPKTKLEKEGDTYKVSNETPDGNKVIAFKSGVEFDDNVKPDLTLKSVYTVDGDTVTQVMKKDDKSVTFKREYTADTLKVTITADWWDGVATRTYKAL